MEILKVENLSKVYGKGNSKVVALDNVSFTVDKGEFVAICVVLIVMATFLFSQASIFSIKMVGWTSLLVLSYFLLGREKTLKSTLGSLLLPVFIKITAMLAEIVNIEQVDLLLATIFGGVLAGTGLGLMHRAGYTSGGTDIINQIFNKYLKISIGKAMMITDGLIIFSGLFYFGFEKFMYALVVLYINTTLADKLIIGISQSKSFYVITSKVDEDRDFVINELGHGVTLFNAEGGFSKENQKVLFCVIPTREYFTFKDGIYKIDEDAFFVVSDSYEVYGGE